MEIVTDSLNNELFFPPANSNLIKVLVDFIKQETLRFRIKKCVIGLSGGLDSTVAAYLTQKALGNTKLTGLLLPYKTSSNDSIRDALSVAKKLNIKTKIINITRAVDSLLNSDKNIDKIRRGNIIARMRMIALYDYSNQINGLVIGTGNKTELLLGYTTIFGDAASAINPLGDLYKSQVRMIAETLKVPKNIINKKPSADLWIGQSDEGEMGLKYKDVDKLLYYMVDMRYSDIELKELGFKTDFIKRIKSTIRNNQFKRVQPIIAKVSNRTINIDFRYNRDWGK